MPANDKEASRSPGQVGFDAFVREMLGSAGDIRVILSANGFGDLPDDALLALAGIGSGGVSMAEMAAILNITRSVLHATIGILIRQGYLIRRNLPAEPNGSQLTLTERARSVADIINIELRKKRWANLSFRQGDIVICTPAKTGTTWLQSICAFLVFQSLELPGSISELSVWLDDPAIPFDEAYAKLEAQENRRIIKSHLPLSDMPFDSRATFITVGRHPLDAALSMYHQISNSLEVAASKGAAQFGQRGLPSPHDELLRMFDKGSSQRDYLGMMLGHLSDAWARRSDPNMLLVHYGDLSADLDGAMRQIAARLGIAVPDTMWSALVRAATFDQMQSKAELFAPSGLELKDPAAFFHTGVPGHGPALFTESELARYNARVMQFAPPDMVTWLHHEGGSNGAARQSAVESDVPA
jgi:aryl sulfotransferase